MADNVPITPGSGAIVSTDEVATLNGQAVVPQHVQRMRLAYGPVDAPLDVMPGQALPVAEASAAAILAKLTADPATGARQASAQARLDLLASEAAVQDLLSRVGPTASDTLLSLLRQVAANTATEAAKVTHLDLTADTLNLSTDNLEGLLTTLNALVASESTLAAFRSASHTDLLAILAKLADPATQTTLAAVLAKLSSDPATQTTLDAVRALLAGTLTSQGIVDVATTVGVTANGQSVSSVIPQGMTTVGAAFSGTYGIATFVFEVSFDGGTTWWPCLMSLGHASGGNAVTGNTLGANSVQWYEGTLPAGATHFRVRTTAIASGTMNVKLAFSQSHYESIVTLAGGSSTALLGSNNAYVGRVRAEGVWQDATSTPLAANGVFTETARDVIATSSGAQFNAGAGVGGAQEFRSMAIADQPGTLCLEVSRDSTTWRRIRSIAMSNVGTDAVGAGTLYEADIVYRPMTRYARTVYVNGATPNTYFNVQTVQMAA